MEQVDELQKLVTWVQTSHQIACVNNRPCKIILHIMNTSRRETSDVTKTKTTHDMPCCNNWGKLGEGDTRLNNALYNVHALLPCF
jgi:hypothetical protein